MVKKFERIKLLEKIKRKRRHGGCGFKGFYKRKLTRRPIIS
jgi:hypothetical protein